MSLAELAALLNGVPGFSGKVAYYAFPENGAPDLPFIVYQETGSNNIVADNVVYKKRKNIEVELYTEFKSETTESSLENMLDAAEIVWQKSEDYLDTERCYMITYSFTI